MSRPKTAAFVTVALVFAATAPAQKVALGGAHDGQIVQLLDCSRLGEGVSIEGLARIVQALGEPALPAANVCALGPDHIAVLGTPQQCAGAERVFAAAVEHAGTEVYIDCKTVRIDAALFARHFEPWFAKALPRPGAAEPAGERHVVVAEKDVVDARLRLRGAPGFDTVQAPKIIVLQLHEARLRIGQDRRYTAEHAMVVGADGATTTRPVERTVFEGDDIAVVATRGLAQEMLVHLKAARNALPFILPQVEVALAGGKTGTIDVPHGTACSVDLCAVVPDGRVLVVAAPLRDGTFVCWLVQVHAIQGH